MLSGEKKSLLVALTRADDAVDVSAVWNDDVTPSDFLYGYMPERFVRNRERAAFTRVGHAGGDESDDLDALGLDVDPRGLVTAARVTLIRNAPDSPRGRDAASALALLAEHGVSSADPDNWNFMATDSSASGAGPASEALEPNDADAGGHGGDVVALGRGRHLGVSGVLGAGEPLRGAASRVGVHILRHAHP